MQRDSKASRKKILKVAERIFAKKGFDGARVDEIAKEAKVNKALIYYYFKSKLAILDEIFKEFNGEVSDLLFKYVGEEMDLEDSPKMVEFFDLFIGYLESRKDILKIMLTESLKSSEEDPPIFGFITTFLEKEIHEMIQSMKKKGYNISDQREQLMVTEFFTGIMPIINYVVFKDKWSRYFNVDPQNLKAFFISAYSATHISYHTR